MTLQRLIREDATNASTPPEAQPRAKVVHGRLRSVLYASRSSALRERAVAASLSTGPRAQESGLHETTMLGDLSRVLSSSLDYTGALRQASRILTERLGCSCVIDLLEATGSVQLGQPSARGKTAVMGSLAPLVADVITHNRPAAATRTEALSDDRRGRALAERTRRDSKMEWIVCAPLSVDGLEPVGALTLAGGQSCVAVPYELTLELAQRMASAIRNGRLYRAALSAAHERQRVLSLVAHELKNPLGVILMGSVQALGSAAESDQCTCRQRELEVIHRSARRMKKLVGDLLDLASIDAGRLSVRPTSCDLSTVVSGALRDLGAAAHAAGVSLVDEPLSALPKAWVDPDRLAQVLVNLLSNAIKFTPRGGRVCVRGARVDGNEIVLEVEDSGRGIAPRNIDRIFEQFWQASDTASKGSGLGLTICRSIVELSGGRIWAESSLGSGTTVYVTLPVAAGP